MYNCAMYDLVGSWLLPLYKPAKTAQGRSSGVLWGILTCVSWVEMLCRLHWWCFFKQSTHQEIFLSWQIGYCACPEMDWRSLTSYRLSSAKYLDAGTGSLVTAFHLLSFATLPQCRWCWTSSARWPGIHPSQRARGPPASRRALVRPWTNRSSQGLRAACIPLGNELPWATTSSYQCGMSTM